MLTYKIEKLEAVVAPGAIADFFRGFIDGLMGR